jgi:protein phosphatase
MHREQAIQHAAVSDVGMRRRNNEDAFAIQLCPDPESWTNRGHLFVVADGMGGHAVGELASKLAVDTLPHTFFKTKEGNPRISLAEAVYTANRTIHSRGSQNRDFQRMGTTCTALALTRMGAIVAHVGDSRCYRIRRDRIDQLTFDHSIVWELARQRGIAPEKVDLIEHRNVITRSLGPELEMQVDLEGPIPILPGDVYVLCSDGLTNHLKDEEIAAAARELAPNQATRLLVQLANLRGGSDNCTVVIVRVGDLPANVQPEFSEPPAEGSSIGWGWLAVSWLVALGIVGGLSLIMFGHLLQGGFLSGLSLVGVVIVLIAYLRERKTHPVIANELSQTVVNRPHRTAVALTSEEFARQLARASADLARTAQEDDWTIKWEEYQQIVETARESFDKKRYTKAAREYCRGLDLLMKEFVRHRSAAMSAP